MDGQQTADIPYLDSHNIALLQSIGELVNSRPISSFSIPELRELFSKAQLPAPANPGVSVSHSMIKTSHGEVKTFLYKPETAHGDVPFIFFCHGGGWIFGCAADYESFVFDLVKRSGVAVVFPEYTLAPEEKYPVQPEQCLEVLQYALKHGSEHGLKSGKVALSGDSVGGMDLPSLSPTGKANNGPGQLTAAISILNHQRSLGLPIVHQILLHPVTDATSDVGSGVFWDPVGVDQQRGAFFSNMEERSNILASPGLMTPEEAKEHMPPTTIITSEHDGFRPEAERFTKLLQMAGVSCGHLQAFASLHAVQIFNASRNSPTAELIMAVISSKFREILGS